MAEAAQLRRDRVVCLLESFWGWFAAPYSNGQPVLPRPWAWVGALRTLLGEEGCLAPLLSTSLSRDIASSLPSWGLLTYPPPSRELPPFLLMFPTCSLPPATPLSHPAYFSVFLPQNASAHCLPTSRSVLDPHCPLLLTPRPPDI